MAYRIGIDIGGTFTDFCAFDDASKELLTLKVLSTPATPGLEVLNGLRQLSERFGVDPADIEYLTHSHTVGVNTVIQRNGARLALLATKNFCDVLELERLRVPDVFNIMSRRAVPLITRDRVLPISERMRSDGTVKAPLDEGNVREAARTAKAMGCEGIIVSFLNAYRNPAHEQRALEILLEEAPDLFAFSSSDVWPLIREFERTITTVLNGYVHPKIKDYLTSLQAALSDEGIAATPMIAKSNGGVMSAERAKVSCAQVLLSGPTMGVIGASHVAGLCGESRALSLDMGGTSADVALIVDGHPQHGIGEHIGEFQLFIPSVSVSSIGAGGGSIARVDPYGGLKVGPDSAGSDPGPACYGEGDEATLTDAFSVCGFLGQDTLGYGAVTLHADRARSAVEAIAGRIGKNLLETAEAIIRVAISGMYLEFGKLMAKHGIDPREFVLLPFGGAGPMVACFLAREMGITRLVIPTTPGVLSALGGLMSDVKNDFIRSVIFRLDERALPVIREGFGELEKEARDWLRDEGHFTGNVEVRYSADMRYQGQKFEIEVPLAEKLARDGTLDVIADNFNRRHHELYDYSDPEAAVEVINLRLVILGISPKPAFKPIRATTGLPDPLTSQEVYFDGTKHKVPVFRRADLGGGCEFVGPAILLQDDTTTCVLDDFKGCVDPYGNLILERVSE